MTKVHIALLGFIFLSVFLYQPIWVYENFWSKAEFYDSIPFTVPYLIFQFIYASITTALTEIVIRSVKKYV